MIPTAKRAQRIMRMIRGARLAVLACLAFLASAAGFRMMSPLPVETGRGLTTLRFGVGI